MSNLRIYYSKSEGWYISFQHPMFADFVWTGTRLYSNFGGGVGLIKMRDPEFFASEMEAKTAITNKVIPWIKKNKPGWIQYID